MTLNKCMDQLCFFHDFRVGPMVKVIHNHNYGNGLNLSVMSHDAMLISMNETSF